MPTTPDRPADLLRAAAQKLRAAAANATEGAWAIWRDLDHQGYITVGNAAGVVTPPALQSAGEECNPVAHVYVEEDAEHIALLHPGVGLALADLLDRHVKEYDASVVAAANVWPNSADEAARWLAAQVPPEALAVARQLLGTTSDDTADDDTLHACPGRWAGPDCRCFDVETSAPPAPADRAATRDRIRRAICEAEGFMWDTDMLEPDEYGEVADAVLAVPPHLLLLAWLLRLGLAVGKPAMAALGTHHEDHIAP